MNPVTRREALLLGGFGTASLAAGTVGLTVSGADSTEPGGGGLLVEPPVRASSGGALSLVLAAAETATQVDGRPARPWTYNGDLPGPTWRVHPGDRVRLRLRNDLPEPTNLHVHGLHVSPKANSDNVFISVDPGAEFQYDYRLPADHPPGVYWYHPHHHGMTADQVFAGLYGAIIVEDPTPIPVSRERVLVISDLTLDSAGRPAAASSIERILGREGATVLVNGQVAPRMVARPGERERWRIVNACTARYLRLRLDGQRLQLLGIDSGRLARPTEVGEVLLAPGNRADVLVTTTTGASTFRTLPVNRGGMSGMMGASQPNQDTISLGTLTVTGASLRALAAVPAQPAPRDLRAAPVSVRRQLTFAMGMGGMSGMGGMTFTIDGRPFDPSRIDTRVRIGTVEEWTLTNTSPMDHPIHLHVWPMQVLEQETEPVWRDVVNVPAHSSVRVRIPFEEFSGRTVYHCHILDHEDAGMMAVVDAV